MKQGFIAIGMLMLFSPVAFASGELPAGGAKRQHTNAVQLPEEVIHSREITRALKSITDKACAAAEHERTKYDRLTVAVTPVKDRFGDPMYTNYGPRAYAGTPAYTGPGYTASFERGESLLLPDSAFRGYYRQAFSNPTVGAQTDIGLGVGANHMYFQSGMMYSPGSQEPSAARSIMNNHQL